MRSVRDNLGRVKTATYTGGRVLTYTYTGDGQLYSVHDSKTGYTYQYTYDSLGRLMSSSVIDSSGNVVFSTRQTYDSNNQLSGQQWRIGGTTYSETYTYSKTTGMLATPKLMLIKCFIINGRFDEDLYQEQCLVLMKAINQFII